MQRAEAAARRGVTALAGGDAEDVALHAADAGSDDLAVRPGAVIAVVGLGGAGEQRKRGNASGDQRDDARHGGMG